MNILLRHLATVAARTSASSAKKVAPYVSAALASVLQIMSSKAQPSAWTPYTSISHLRPVLGESDWQAQSFGRELDIMMQHDLQVLCTCSRRCITHARHSS